MMKYLAWLGVAFYIGLGLLFMFWMPDLPGIRYVSADGWPTIRAMFSGLSLGIGAVMAIFVLNRVYVLAVFVGAVATSGLAVARLYSMVMDNAFTHAQVVHFVPETLGIAVGIALWPQFKAALKKLGESHGEKPSRR